eukprot:12937163-Prorocentrum_lima.AAC.1
MELFDSDLHKLLRTTRPTQGDAYMIAKQLGSGLDYLHLLVHLDMKPNNILWMQLSRRAVLADFSCSETICPR